ncbi:MAG: thiamine pyrophosphate-dependent dehydrogenase E1 component subunit alpha [Chloroflexi bacterium]|nr:thiamine pyrophosphate-dependent dehydrogenase E1 component subunit alpha [Chloroflexota bacterium]
MDISPDTLKRIYETMVTIRAFEERSGREIPARGISGALHLSVGQEAVPAGICAHLTNEDYLASTHRGHGHCIAKGVDPKRMMAELFGRVGGTNKGKGGSMHIADVSVGMLGANGVVGASVPLACGAALKVKIQGGDSVAVAFFGDGGANQGIVHECMNLASIWTLPVIFVCENNLYAESTPVEYALSVPNVADRAAGYSMPGVIADGMDAFDVYRLAGEAVERARSGEGPTLLECKTYRYYGHYSGDNPKTYRTDDEEREWRARDPIQGFRTRVLEENLLPASELDGIEERVAVLIDQAVKYAEESPLPTEDELFTAVYADYPLDALQRGQTVQ